MYTTVQRTSQWKPSSHVCLSCQQRLLTLLHQTPTSQDASHARQLKPKLLKVRPPPVVVNPPRSTTALKLSLESRSQSERPRSTIKPANRISSRPLGFPSQIRRRSQRATTTGSEFHSTTRDKLAPETQSSNGQENAEVQEQSKSPEVSESGGVLIRQISPTGNNAGKTGHSMVAKLSLLGLGETSEAGLDAQAAVAKPSKSRSKRRETRQLPKQSAVTKKENEEEAESTINNDRKGKITYTQSNFGKDKDNKTQSSKATQEKKPQEAFGLSAMQKQLNASIKPPLSIVRERHYLPPRLEKKSSKPEPFEDVEEPEMQVKDAVSLNALELQIEPLNIEQPPVPKLSYGLERVLFNPGVYQLQDPHSRVFNFDPYLQKIMPIQEFDFTALKAYKTSSEDDALATLAQEHGKKYIGSTSSMTGALSHFHFLLSHFRPINTNMLSKDFFVESNRFTGINRAPYGVFLRWKNGSYAIDADKEHDSPNVLMMLGKSMEKLLTMSKKNYERYRKGDSRGVPQEEREAPEAYQYTTMGDMLMRSQLDAHDERLPGNGTFDLKTRAVVSIRMDAANYEQMLGYEITTQQGQWESFEREYYDMLRSTMLKYMLQARMGRMDGIFMAYHNIERMFGFQYLPLWEIDRAMHGQVNTCLGDQEFKLSLRMFNDLLNAATAKFPEQSLRLLFETEGTANDELVVMRFFAEPMDETEIEQIQSTSKTRNNEYEQEMMGIIKEVVSEPTTTNKQEEEAEAEGKDKDNMVKNDDAFASSDTDADLSFLKEIEAKTKRPLYCAMVLVESFVNDELVVRPEQLKPADEWTVNYSIVEMPAEKSAESWAFYGQAKARRSKVLDKNDEDEDDEAKKGNAYLHNLVNLVAKGRKYRRMIEHFEGRKKKVVL